MQDIHWGSLIPPQRCSRWILQPQPGNKGILRTPKLTVRFSFEPYPGHSLGQSYSSVEMQSAYSTTQVDWAGGKLNDDAKLCMCLNKTIKGFKYKIFKEDLNVIYPDAGKYAKHWRLSLFRYETFIHFLTFSLSTRGERDTIFTILTVLTSPTVNSLGGLPGPESNLN